MLLCNTVGSAYKSVTAPEVIQRLRDAGWHEVIPEQPAPLPEVAPPAAPKVDCVVDEPLKYKDLYLSWYVQCGSVKQLREVLSHLGVTFEKTTVKKELQRLLRKEIQRLKEEKA